MPLCSVRFASKALLVCTGILGGCGTDAMGTDACRKIEQARCRKAPACPDLTVQAGTGVDECVAFARDRCLHGLAVADPGVAAVDQCVSAIDHATSCDPVASPSNLTACAFLLPGQAAIDASDEGAASTPADAALSDAALSEEAAATAADGPPDSD
jgi:hypothetical protein